MPFAPSSGRVPLTTRGTLYAFAALCGCLAVTSAFSQLPRLAVIFVVATTVACVWLGRLDNVFHMTWLTGHVVFTVVPSLICVALRYPISYELAALCTALGVVAMALTDRPAPVASSIWRPKPSGFLWFLLAAAAAMVLTGGRTFTFTVPALVLMHAAASRGRPLHVLIGLYVSIVAYVMAYATLYWLGFGRLILAGILLLPTLLVACELRIPFAKVATLATAAVAGVLGTIIRFGGVTTDSILETSLSDSNSGPLLFGESFVVRARFLSHLDVSGWFDQIILFFVAVWPRVWWEGKPLGFGAAWVDDNLGPDYWGHSIASTFMGEHIYYLGIGWGTVASLLAVAMLSHLYNVVAKTPQLFGMGGYLVAVYVPTFYWGGLASFSSRFLAGVIPLVVTFAAFRLLKLSIGATPAAASTSARRLR